MGKSMVTDLAVACLVFWSIIGILLTWYVWRIRKFNLGHNTSHKLEEEQETEPLLLENFQESEAVYDLQEETDLNDHENPKKL